MGRPQPPHRSTSRLRWIAIALGGASAAAAALILAGPIWSPQTGPADPPSAPPEPASPPPTATPSARSAAELNEALQGSTSPPPTARDPGDKAPKPADDGAVAWDVLTKRCMEDVGRSSPGQTLRLLDSTGFVPQTPEARTRLGFDWDQAVRLTLQPGSGDKTVGVECYFLKGTLAGKSRS